MLPRNRRINRLMKRSVIALAATSASAGMIESAFAQQGGTWTYNGNDNWSAFVGWLEGNIANGAGNLASFSGFGTISPLDTLTVTLDTNRTIGSVNFADGDGTNSPAGWALRQTSGSVLTLEQVPNIFTGITPQPGLNVNNLGAGNGTSQIGTLAQKIANISAGLAGVQGFNKTGAGTAVLSGNNAGLGGSITLSQGILILNSSNAMGGATLLTQRTGQLAFRGDSAFNHSATNIDLQNDTTFGTGNSIGIGSMNGVYGTGANLAHTIGNVTIDTYGVRTLGISGSNGYGLNLGVLALRDGINLINEGDQGFILGSTAGIDNGGGVDSSNNVNGQGSGLVTIGTITYSGTGLGTINLGGVGSLAGNITVTNGISNLGGGSANLVYSGSRTATINGAVGTGGDTYVTGDTTGSLAVGDFQAGVGTLVLNSGALASNRSVTVMGGTLVLGAAVTHNVSNIAMGGATLTSGAVPAHVNTGAGTVAIGSGGVVVNDSVLFDTGNTVANVNATAGGISGRLDLGGSNRNFEVNGISTLTVDAVVNGSGGIVKTGVGAMHLTNANTFTGSIDLRDGVLSGRTQGAGNSLGSIGANVSMGGALRMNGTASAGTGTVNILTIKDTGIHTGLTVDASVGGVTTLNINNWGGREGGTQGTVKVVPVTGSLNTNEIINITINAPGITNGILPAYIAVQNSGTNTQLGFASLSSSRIVAFNNYQGGDINAASTVYDLAASGVQSVTGTKTLFAARLGAGAQVGGGTLQLGNGTTGFGGLIMNGNALINANTVQTSGSEELVIWSGGDGTNSISANLNLMGDLTTGGSTALELSGTTNFNGSPKNITVTGATVTLNNSSALSGASTMNKRGGGVLAVTGANLGFFGTTTVHSGTLQLGDGGAAGSVGGATITNNANVSYNVLDVSGSGAGSFGNAMGGTGNVWVNTDSTGIVTLAGPLSYTGRTTVQSGTLRIDGLDRLPTGTALRVDGGATFNLNGSGQTIGGLSGAGTIVNSSAVASQATLTVNGGGTWNGSLRNAGAGVLALVKTGSDTLILNAANDFNGTISLLGGTLQVNTNGALSATGPDSNIVMNGGALLLNIPNNQNITPPNLFFSGSSTISVMTNPPVNLGINQDGTGPGINSGANSWQGDGTVNLVLNGRMLNIGDQGGGGGNTAILNAFSGTLKFDDSNPVGSRVRFGLGVNNFTAGSAFATFAFGNGFNSIHHRNGSAQFNLGYVTGGTNTILEGHSNGGGRPVGYNFGLMGGDQTYHGQIRDYTLNGGTGVVHITKWSSGTLTLKNTLGFTGGVTVNAGTLFFGSGANLTNSASIIVNGGTFSMLPGSTISSQRTIATINPGFPTGGFDVSNFPGFVTPGRMTFTGGGTVYGTVNHAAGSINPGSIGGPGTLTFANSLVVNNGSVDFDVNPGSVNLLGGTNDVLKIDANNGLTLTSGIIRVNFLGAGTTPPPTLAVNQFYPLIAFNGTYSGATTNIFTTAKFRGSFLLEQGTGSLSNTLGAKVIALGGATNNLVWNPISNEFNAWDAAIGFTNWKPLVGAGSLFFFNGDSVTFDDTTTIRTVQLTPGLAPTAITVNTDNTYIFSGQGLGSITGSGGLVKNGTGTLFISGNNSYTGGTTINGGTLVVGDPNVAQLTPEALGGGNATTTFNNDSNFRFLSPLPNTFSGPGRGAPSGANVAGGNFVFNPGTHRIQIAGSNQTHPWNINLYGSGTIVFERPNLDNNNSNITFNQGTFPIAVDSAVTTVVNPFASFAGTVKVNDLTNFLAGSNQGSAQLRDGTILRVNSALTGNPSMTIDMGLGTAGFTLGGGAGQTLLMGALRGGPNTFLKQAANNTAGTFVIAGVGPQYDSTFDGLFRATNNNNINAAAVQLVHVVKGGSASTLTLKNIQPYVGNTIVNGGTLALVNAAANTLASPTIIIGTNGILDVSGLSGGGGTFTLNADQRIISNGDVVGTELQVVSTSTIGGTKFTIPLVVDDAATISPGNSVGTLTVSNLLLDGQVDFLIEVDQSGIDTLVLDGTQTEQIVNAVSALHLVNLGGFIPGTYTFLDYEGDPNAQGPIANGFQVAEEGFAYGVTVLHDTVNTKVLLQFVDNSAQWFVNSDGQWSTPGSWTLDGTNPATLVPNSVTFGTFIDAPRTVTVNGTIGNVANSIVFDSPHTYTIAGTGTLTMDSGVVAPITVNQGNHAITAPVRALRTLGVSVAGTSTLSFGGTITNANNAGVTKIGGGTATFTRLNMPGGTLNVSAGKVVMSTKAAANSADGTNVVAAMTIAPGASVDLANNAMILDYNGAIGAGLTDLRAELADGRLFSSTAASNEALGYRNNNTGTTPTGGTGTAGLGLATTGTFAGVTGLDNTSVLIRVTYKGDTNLDGVVNLIDLFNLSLNWLSSNGVWAGGDFNYDGLVNKADLAILANSWQLGQDNPLPSDSLEAALTAAGIPLSSVPEPTTLALAGVGAAGLLTRRRRRAS